MIIILNGNYTRDFMKLFYAAYEQPNFEVFSNFCKEHMLSNDDVIDILDEAYGEEFLEDLDANS